MFSVATWGAAGKQPHTAVQGTRIRNVGQHLLVRVCGSKYDTLAYKEQRTHI